MDKGLQQTDICIKDNPIPSPRGEQSKLSSLTLQYFPSNPVRSGIFRGFSLPLLVFDRLSFCNNRFYSHSLTSSLFTRFLVVVFFLWVLFVDAITTSFFVFFFAALETWNKINDTGMIYFFACIQIKYIIWWIICIHSQSIIYRKRYINWYFIKI